MSERRTSLPTPSSHSSEAMVAVVMERQVQMHAETVHHLTRIERKVDAMPEKVRKAWRVMLVGTWFGDTQSRIMWFGIILVLTGHVSLEKLIEKIL